ncbi:MAG: hypothetical protein WDK95_15840 [Syntrophorhabdaceae bacterium]
MELREELAGDAGDVPLTTQQKGQVVSENNFCEKELEVALLPGFKLFLETDCLLNLSFNTAMSGDFDR